MVLHAIKFGNTDWLELTWGYIYVAGSREYGKEFEPHKVKEVY
jgi:hypothetical protein